MKNRSALIATVALALFPMGAEASSVAPPPAGGTVSIQADTTNGASDPAMPAFLDAISIALTARGFTVFEDQGHAASILEIELSRADVGMGVGKVPGQRAASVAGTGLAVPLGTGNSQQTALRRVRLEMRMHRRGDPTVIWDAAAVTVRQVGTSTGSDKAVANDLSRALLQAYPTQPNAVIGVP